MTAGILTVLAMMPGMPAVPCLVLAAGLMLAARKAGKASEAAGATATAEQVSADRKRSPNEDVDAALTLDLLSLEVGYELIAMVEPTRGGTLLDRVAALRQQLAKETGVVMPPIHVCDNLQLPPGAYRVLVSGNPIGEGLCRSGRLLAIDASGGSLALEGEKTLDPTFGMVAWWIAPRDKEMAEALGYAVVDHATIVATHLGELLRANAHRLIGRQEAQHLLEVLARSAPKLVDDVVPNLLSLGDMVRVLKNLVREGVSIRDLRTILESLAELSVQTKDVEQLTELVRERLGPHITARVKSADGSVAALTLDPRLEDMLRRSLRDIASGAGGALDPEMLRGLTATAERAMPKFAEVSAAPLVVTSPDLRRYVRAIFERKLPNMAIVSFREIDPSVSLRVLDRLAPGGPALTDQGGRT